jgi:hypothetical protein
LQGVVQQGSLVPGHPGAGGQGSGGAATLQDLIEDLTQVCVIGSQQEVIVSPAELATVNTVCVPHQALSVVWDGCLFSNQSVHADARATMHRPWVMP